MYRRLALLSGPLMLLLCWALPLPLALSAKFAAGITLWMAVWWITEPVNTAVTALLPLVLFPLTGVLPMKTTAAEYSNEIVYLFMAGFMFGKAIEHWSLHRRIALEMVDRIGADPARMLLGFMAATAFVSMWISNTATSVMMTPVAVAVLVGRRHFDANFAKALMLGIGYAASIGGMATVVGTPTNAIFVSFANQKLGEGVSFSKWLLFGFPFALVLMMLCWWLLLRLFPFEKNTDPAEESHTNIRAELFKLGKTSVPEKLLVAVFGTVVLGWVSGSLVWYDWLKWSSAAGDTVVMLAGVIVLFLLPSDGRGGEPLLTWKIAEKIPWGVVVFFGGGLAMAKGFDASGLALWLGSQMEALQPLPLWLILLVVLTVVVLLSEIASNIATASMMMPVLASLAGALGVHPFGLLMSATIAASVGFGLPVATAPNTIVFGSGFLTTRDMARAGFLLDVIAIVLLVVFVYTVMPWAWGIEI